MAVETAMVYDTEDTLLARIFLSRTHGPKMMLHIAISAG